MSGNYIDYFIGMDTTDYKKEIREIERQSMNNKIENIKEKELEAAKKIVEELEAEADKKRKKWHKFEDAGCRKCGSGGYVVNVTDYGITSGYDRVRCDCTYKKTNRYKKALKDKDLSVKEYEKKINKFKDNNGHIESHYHSTDRSW